VHTVQRVGAGSRSAALFGTAVQWVAIGVVLLTSLRAIPDEAQFSESLNRDRRAAGEWIARQARPAHPAVMDLGLQVAYYAGADLIYLPFAESDVALRYVARKKPDYIVLVEDATGGLPYTAKWFSEGIPDKRAVLVYDERPRGGEHIRIYRWEGSAP